MFGAISNGSVVGVCFLIQENNTRWEATSPWYYPVNVCFMAFWHVNTVPKSLATLDGQIVDSEIALESEMRDAPKVHGAQT